MMKKLLVCFVAIMLLFSGCGVSDSVEPVTDEVQSNFSESEADGIQINLSDDKITVDGKNITNDNTQSVYSLNDIVFYPEGKDFTFGEGTKDDEHSQTEADSHTVVHIAKPGKYILSGKLSAGQIAVDLGKDAKENPAAVVTLVLNNVDISCTVAPAIIFYNVYEPFCEITEETATKDVDTENAGANVIIADGTENNINGSYVAKIYKSYELSEDGTEVVDSKKLHKYDGAFYSKMTMNMDGGEKGNGVLNIKAENEGLDSELHLTINGGIINITSGNDGINTNEDNISVTTINGGSLNIICDGTTGEGDGIDSNGWLVINDGAVTAQACSTSGDAGIDSDKGIYINGGKVMATGNMLDHIAGGTQTYAVFSFTNLQNGGNTYTLKAVDGKIVGEYVSDNAFTYLIIAGDELAEGEYNFWQDDTQLSAFKSDNMQGGMMPGERPEMPNGEMPEDFTPPEMPNGGKPEDFTPPEMPEGFTPPEMPNGARPDMPEGMTPPGNAGGMMGGNMMPGGESSDIFTITDGGNQFENVDYTK